jgi:hypothetical protein
MILHQLPLGTVYEVLSLAKYNLLATDTVMATRTYMTGRVSFDSTFITNMNHFMGLLTLMRNS